MMVSLFCFAAALLASVVLHSNIVASYIALVVCGFFLKAATSPFWSIPGRIASPEVAGGARGVINGLGNLGGFCGPYLVGIMTMLWAECGGVLAGGIAGGGRHYSALLPRNCDINPSAPRKIGADERLMSVK
ncbi:hypothetical protein LZ023_35055 (plasmid) [Pseudomonas silvicola]|nr:hypothetical protein LZ023_35055 [Pseudomonas silvicola]